jgi:hypothetical protein
MALGAFSARRLAAGSAGPAPHDITILAIDIHLVADGAGEPAFAYLHIRFAGRWPPALAVACAVTAAYFPYRPADPSPHQTQKRATTQPLLGGRLIACLLAAIGNIGLVMNAIETTGVVDAQHQLRLDKPLPIAGQSRVRVIVLVPEEADISETAWTKTAATSPAFDFLKDAAEDIYTAADGKPFHDQG